MATFSLRGYGTQQPAPTLRHWRLLPAVLNASQACWCTRSFVGAGAGVLACIRACERLASSRTRTQISLSLVFLAVYAAAHDQKACDIDRGGLLFRSRFFSPSLFWLSRFFSSLSSCCRDSSCRCHLKCPGVPGAYVCGARCARACPRASLYVRACICVDTEVILFFEPFSTPPRPASQHPMLFGVDCCFVFRVSYLIIFLFLLCRSPRWFINCG